VFTPRRERIGKTFRDLEVRANPVLSIALRPEIAAIPIMCAYHLAHSTTIFHAATAREIVQNDPSH
jgi:hypothetical protein